MEYTVGDTVLRIIEDQLVVRKEEFTFNSNLTDELNADSLDIVELIMACEDEFCISITDEETEKVDTVGHLIALVERKLL